ncbi:condensation domain-containing protein, partial [Pleionea sp. CnH1-48]|uniref:condensation domain-containing protein n=1 Tax=Pleionea sp. CnH1-48 TaxID=2954494 RepID=UPI002097AD0F
MQQLLEKAAQHGVFLSYDGEYLKYELTVDEFPEDIKQDVLQNKQQLIDFFKAVQSQGESVERPSLTPRENSETSEVLSFAQQRLWFIDQLEGGSPEYNMPIALRVEGSFDVEIAEQALQ